VLLIQDEADIVGATLADQAAAIVSNASVFEAIVAKVSGLRQATDKALLLATTSAEREAVLDAATIQATEMATAYGLIA
jgi:molybdopterin synthase catalytic subunit